MTGECEPATARMWKETFITPRSLLVHCGERMRESSAAELRAIAVVAAHLLRCEPERVCREKGVESLMTARVMANFD